MLRSSARRRSWRAWCSTPLALTQRPSAALLACVPRRLPPRIDSHLPRAHTVVRRELPREPREPIMMSSVPRSILSDRPVASHNARRDPTDTVSAAHLGLGPAWCHSAELPVPATISVRLLLTPPHDCNGAGLPRVADHPGAHRRRQPPGARCHRPRRCHVRPHGPHKST